MKWYLITHNGKTYRIPAANDAEAIASASNMLNLRGILGGVQPKVLSPGGVPDDQLQSVLGSSNVIDLSGTSTPGGDDGTQGDGHTGALPTLPELDPKNGDLGYFQTLGGQFDEEDTQAGLTGAFTRALKNRGVSGAGSLGDYYRGRQGAYQAAFGAGQAQGQFADVEGQPPRSFEQFAGTNNNPYANLSQAFGKFSQLNTAQAGRDPNAFLQYQYADPRDEEGGGYAAANQLAAGAFQGRLGGATGQRYGRALPRLQEEYDSMDNIERQGTNYLDFLRKRLGLSNVQF